MAGLLLSLAKDLLKNPIPMDQRNSKLSWMMQELKNKFPVIRTLEGAEQRQLEDERVMKWLNCVKDVYYDVIDVFEECSILQMKFQKQRKGSLLSFSFSFFNPMRQSIAGHDAAMMIRHLMEKIDLVKQDECLLNLTPRWRGSNRHREVPPRVTPLPTISIVDEERIFGRDSERGTLKSNLLNESNQQHSTCYFSIVGIGGIGKTTLAQLLYNNEEVRNHFELKVWICVSQEFNVARILRNILLSVPVESYPRNEVESDSELLIQRFRQIIGGKRFLFVLDDVWSDSYSTWEPLKYAFECGAPGSAILITTRSTQVARTAGSAHTVHLGGLSENDSWAMARHLVFGAPPNEIEIETCLEELGRQIINKCGGVPAVVKAVGGLLSAERSVEDWQQVLLEFHTFSEVGDFLMSTLMLSYCHLRPQLRQCLLFCSIFPKNHSIDVDKLIKLWMAQNFVASGKDDDMEREGQHCFEELLNCPFFQDLIRDDNGNLLCNMDSLMTDFIKLLAENECSIMHVDQNTEIEGGLSFREVRHWTLSVAGQASLPIFIRYSEKVHTLIIMSEYSFIDPTSLSKLLRHFKMLRALDLSHCLLGELPLKIGKLLHLRFLDLSFNYALKELPEAICDLLLLQTLNLNGCDNLQNLPHGIGNLIFLRHLEILWTKCLSYLPKGIRGLTSLRTLNRFFGSGVVGSRACDLGDLENLSYLQGYISIDGLGGVTDVALAEKAALKNKINLLGMDLWFSGVAFDNKDGAILEALQPPPNLKSLGIFSYKGTSFPRWMAGMKQLRHLMLSDCSGCEVLPPLGTLPLLESLEIRNLINVRKVGAEFFGIESDHRAGSKKVFPELKKLNFHNLTNWEKWDEITRRGENVTIMPKLSSLSLVRCAKIKAVPDCIKSIENLSCHIEECPLLNEKTRGKLRRLNQFPRHGHLFSLSALKEQSST